MIPPVRCYTCGKVLGNKHEYFKKEKLRKKLAMNVKEEHFIIDLNADDIKKFSDGEIMDELGCIRICCRKTIMTSIDIINEI